jgi:hypothetical protein
VTLGNTMPRFVAEKADDGSGPVETILGSNPLGPFWPALPRPDPKSVLRMSLLPQNGVNCLQVGGFLFVDLTHVRTVSLISPVDAGDMKTSLRLALLVVKDALNFPGCFDRLLRFGGGTPPGPSSGSRHEVRPGTPCSS